MKNRKTSRMRCLLLALLAGAMVLHTAAALPTVADQVTLTEGEEASGAGEISAGAKPETGLTAVGENDNFLMEYDEENADLYVTDKRSGKVWSNAVSAAYYGEEAESRRNFLTNLMTVRVASESGNLTQYNITAAGGGTAKYTVTPTHQNGEGKVTLDVSVARAGGTDVALRLEIWLDEDGLNCAVPADGIQENNGNMLVSLTIMPAFGAALSTEDGYMLVPDGSGTLIHFKGYDLPNTTLQSLPLYGANTQDIELIDQNKEQNIYNVMLPVYGIRHHDGAMLAAVTEGAGDMSLNVALGGYQVANLNRAYFQIDYRTYATHTVNDKEYTTIAEYKNPGDHAVKYFLLDDEHNDYSGMAVSYREYLVENGLLSKSVTADGVPMAVDLFMGATERGFFFDKFITATSYSDAQTIAQELKAGGIDDLQIKLLAWGKGGYDTLPTAPKAERRLGGNSALERLMAFCKGEFIDLYLNMDFLNANKNTGSFNSRNDVNRSSTGRVITIDNRFILNPVKTFVQQTQAALSGLDFAQGGSISFDAIGSTVMYDYSNDLPTSREQALQSYVEGLALAREQLGKIAVTGGNSYVLPYASRLSDIPDKDSRYFVNDESVPFFQMVVHGYIDYTSVPGNQAYDLTWQKLRWIEYGSAPYFLLTAENPIVLNNSSYNELFSSEYAVWKDTVLEIGNEFNERLSEVWDQPMVRHEKLAGDVVKVTYENGMSVIINYTEEAYTADGVTVPALDYVVTGGGR